MAKVSSKKELSKCLSWHLDQLGFDRRRIRERIHASNRSSRAKVISTKQILQTNEIEKIFVGSKREGTGLEYFNNLDVLQINHGLICVKDKRTIDTHGKLVFRMIQNKCPAGYTYLKLQSKETSLEKFQYIRYALVKRKSGRFLSSQLFMTKNDDVFRLGDGFISKNTHYKARKGPSIPKYVEMDTPLVENYLSEFNLKDTVQMDFVRAFPCQADTFLEAWGKRERKCGWPSRKTVDHVMSLPAYVVPVGQKNSINNDLQWRISFTMAETHLVQAFNNIQTKVFVLMKLIAKYILQPLCKDVTTYVVKMIILWLAEKTPQKKFRKKHLIARLTDALVYLKTAVENKFLPSYMIPSRNLFANKLQMQQQRSIVVSLNCLIQNGCKMITDYFCNKHAHENKISSVCRTIYVANQYDKLGTCDIALYSTKQLADYFSRMFFMSTRWQIIIYNTIFDRVPYFFAYGIRGFSNPLSLDLSRRLAETEKRELAAHKRESNKRQLTVPQQPVLSPEWNPHTCFVKKPGLQVEKLVFLLFCSAIYVTFLLLTQSRSCLIQIVRAMYSDGTINEPTEDNYRYFCWNFYKATRQ